MWSKRAYPPGRVACQHSRSGRYRLPAFLHRRGFLLVQLPIGLVSVAALVWRVDLSEAVRRLPDIDYRWAVPGLAVFTLSKLIHAYRWRVFLWRHQGLPLGQLFAIFLTANLVNALIPLRVGDLLRVELPSRRFGIPRAELTSSVFVVESLLDGVAFVILMFIGLVLLDVPPIFPSLLAVMSLAVAVAFFATVALSRVDGERDFASMRVMRWLPGRLRGRTASLLPQFIEGLASLSDARRAAWAILVSLIAWSAEVAVYWMIGQAFGLDLAAAAFLPIMIAANLIVSIPITPWDLGPYEVAVTEVTALSGATRAVASSFAVGSHLLLLIWVGISGIIGMWALDLRPQHLLRGGEASLDAATEAPADEAERPR